MRHKTVAIVQAAPIPLAIDAGIDDMVQKTAEAIAQGAHIIAFGETFLGGYPLWLDESPNAALWDHAGTKALHSILLHNALIGDDPRLAPVQQLADTHGVIICFGAHQRDRSSLYNAQYILRPEMPAIWHRKLVPTHGERLIWARGDGSTLGVHQSDFGAIGNLICWEHWMPLARAAMHNQSEVVHIAAWPTVRESYAIASRHYAFEGRCFVLAAGTLQHRDDLLNGLERTGATGSTLENARELLLQIPDGTLQFGGSAIIGPDAMVIASAGVEAETLIAQINLEEITEQLASLDTDGHYSRPDVFELHVNTRATPGVIWDDKPHVKA